MVMGLIEPLQNKGYYIWITTITQSTLLNSCYNKVFTPLVPSDFRGVHKELQLTATKKMPDDTTVFQWKGNTFVILWKGN